MPLNMAIKMGFGCLIIFAGGIFACIGGYKSLKDGKTGGGMYGTYSRQDHPVSYWLVVGSGFAGGIAMLLFAVALPFLPWH